MHQKLKKEYRTYKHFNESHFLDELQHTAFQVAKIINDSDDQFWFHNIDSNAPRIKQVIKAEQLPFMDVQPGKAINVKGMLRKKSLKFKTQENIWTFQTQSSLVTCLTWKSLRWYLNENCKKNHDDRVKQRKCFWKTAGLFVSDNVKEKDKIILEECDNVIVNTKDVCNVCNEYFINTAKGYQRIWPYQYRGTIRWHAISISKSPQYQWGNTKAHNKPQGTVSVSLSISRYFKNVVQFE